MIQIQIIYMYKTSILIEIFDKKLIFSKLKGN